MRRAHSTLLLVLVFAGCGGAGGRTGGGGPNLINNEELRSVDSEGLSLYQAIQRFRPQWLSSRGTSSFGAGAQETVPRVIVDNVPFGEIDELRRIDASDVMEASYLGGSDATTRFGTGYPGGAIVVRTR